MGEGGGGQHRVFSDYTVTLIKWMLLIIIIVPTRLGQEQQEDI